MSTTEAHHTTDCGHAHPRNNRRFIKRHWGKLLALVLVLAGFVWAIAALTSLDSENRVDGQARDKFVAQRIEAASKMTDGGVQAENWPYDWDSSQMRVYVRVTLGTCPNVDAYVPMKAERPRNYGETGPLVIVAPAVRRYEPSALVSITASNFYETVSSSALTHCISSDSRFTNIPPTE